MGFAKYQEDIISRSINDMLMHQPSVPISPHKPVASGVPIQPTVSPPKQGNPKMSSLKKHALPTPRPLPVIILADVSGSMSEDGKIEALNAALKDMMATFSKESRLRAEIQVGLITFGERTQWHLPLVAARSASGLEELSADGMTPMGAAFDLARELLEDKDRIPSRAFRPVLILLSDGQPNDDWEGPFKALCESDRAQKATRLAMAIGADADEDMLREFPNHVEAPLFKAENARDIHRFFRAVTISVTTRTVSQNPNMEVPFVVPPPDDDHALDLDFP